MGLFSGIISRLFGRSASTATNHLKTPNTGTGSPLPLEAADVSISISYSGPTSRNVVVSQEDVQSVLGRYAFVLGGELPSLKTADQWWEEATHKRRLKSGSEKAYLWMAPFIDVDVVKREQLQSVAGEWGPIQSIALAKELRAIIRERRKSRQPHEDLLRALYGACVLADFTKSLEFEGRQPHAMTQYVDVHEVSATTVDYSALGYLTISSLGKTDVKWLIEAFGEPAEHQSYDAAWPNVRRNAIRRHCWTELQQANQAAKSLGLHERTMEEWLYELIERNLGYRKEWEQRVAARDLKEAEAESTIAAARLAMDSSFVVADLETTGLNPATDEVLEFGAVCASPSGEILAEFVALVRISGAIPTAITELTGITPEVANREGVPVEDAYREFLRFVGTRPVFFHNAPFDVGFIRKIAAKTKLDFDNAVHDVLPLARSTWPSLGTYKLAALAEHVGCGAPQHRALGDAKAALGVLIAARAARTTARA